MPKYLRRSTETIVNQVEALKKMVNEFSEYARAPELEFHQLDFNGLVKEVLALYEASGMAAGGVASAHLSGRWPRICRQSEGTRLGSARLSTTSCKMRRTPLIDVAEPSIMVRTETVPGGVRFSVSDNGMGFSNKSNPVFSNRTLPPSPKEQDWGCPSSKK